MEKSLKQQFRYFCNGRKKKDPIDKLTLCAEFLNKGDSKEEWSFYLLEGTVALWQQPSFITFESQEVGQQAYGILGEKLILAVLNQEQSPKL